jgi:hypothetical protein
VHNRVMRFGASRVLVVVSLGLAACAPDNQIGDRPDARAGLDAALPPDGGASDAPAPDAPMESDAPLPLDDAPTPSDAPVPEDAGQDAFVSDAGRDAAMPDAFTPADAGPVWTIGFCRVQFPTTIMASAGTSTTVYGRVYALGLTPRTSGTDTDALLVGEVGSGPDGSHPTPAGWTWTRASANAAYGPGSAGFEANNDEYQASLSRPSAGSFDFAFRFSGDGGLSWTYCDTLDAGSSDGYQLANAGSLSVM